MFGLFFLLLIVVPLVEFYVLFQVADSFGWLTSLASLLLISLVGGALVRWQTSGAWTRVTDKIRAGQMPSNELVDGALMIFGGALLLTPGFFTDAVGLSMFIPPLRAVARRLVLSRTRGRVTTLTGAAGSARTAGGTGPFGATFTTGGYPGRGFSTGPNSRPDARTGSFIDIDEVHVERVDDTPHLSPPPE